MTYRIKIGMRLPSANDYIDVCRRNPYQAAKFKRDTEEAIALFLIPLPRIQRPVRIHFRWVEENKKRDLDNVAFAKKFILDAMVQRGKLQDDNRRFVTAFYDTFEYAAESCVMLEIMEVEE